MLLRCALFSKSLGLISVLVELSQWAKHEDIQFFDTGKFWPLPVRRFSFFIIIYKIYISWYNNMWNIFSLNRLEAKVNIFGFQFFLISSCSAHWDLSVQVEPQKLWKRAHLIMLLICSHEIPTQSHTTWFSYQHGIITLLFGIKN